MAMQNKRSMIDARWRALQPVWGPKEHGGEHEMLYDVLEDDESIESLVGCVWGPGNVFRANANRWDRMRQYDGIAVLTGRRVVLLKKKGTNKLITEMPLHNMESVDVDATGEVTLTGRSYSEWAGQRRSRGFQDAGRTRQLRPEFRRPGAGSKGRAAPLGQRPPRLRLALPSPRRTTLQRTRRSGSTPSGGSARPCGVGNDPSVPERLIAGLLSSFTGENVTTYPGELRILYEVLEDAENIEYWMGGRWGDASEFNTLGDAIGTMVSGLKRHEFGVHNGVVVATDRRVLMLNSGTVSKDVVEVPMRACRWTTTRG